MAMVISTMYSAPIWNLKGKGQFSQLPISIVLPLWSGINGVFLHDRCIP
jgi:hypothetical protein